MSSRDLTQRYVHTYVKYGGEVGYVKAFGPDGSMLWARYIGESQFLDDVTVFNHLLLDISRPPSRWYSGENKSPVFFYHKMEKQYSRGVSDKNSCWFSPGGMDVSLKNFCLDLFNEENWNLNKKTRFHVSELALEKFWLLSPYMAIDGLGRIFYKNIRIGRLINKIISLERPLFKQELQEHIFGARYEMEQL